MFSLITQCPSAASNFTSNCLLSGLTLEASKALLHSISTGVCTQNLKQIFSHCLSPIATPFFRASNCYSSTGGLTQCLPGAYAHLTPTPNRCKTLSMLVFLMNESSAFFKSSKTKLIVLTATQILRYVEVQLCAQRCENPIHKYHLFGPKEQDWELYRHTLGFTNHLIHEYVPSHYIHLSSQLYLSLGQQQARNQDFELGYEQCTELPKPIEPNPKPEMEPDSKAEGPSSVETSWRNIKYFGAMTFQKMESLGSTISSGTCELIHVAKWAKNSFVTLCSNIWFVVTLPKTQWTLSKLYDGFKIIVRGSIDLVYHLLKGIGILFQFIVKGLVASVEYLWQWSFSEPLANKPHQHSSKLNDNAEKLKKIKVPPTKIMMDSNVNPPINESLSLVNQLLKSLGDYSFPTVTTDEDPAGSPA